MTMVTETTTSAAPGTALPPLILRRIFRSPPARVFDAFT